jgi:hypothetical protein
MLDSCAATDSPGPVTFQPRIQLPPQRLLLCSPHRPDTAPLLPRAASAALPQTLRTERIEGVMDAAMALHHRYMENAVNK